MNGYEKLVKEQLLKHGYKLVRTGKGSHEIWASEKGVSVTVIMFVNHGTLLIAS